MKIDLHNRHFLKLLDFTPEEIDYFLELAAELKKVVKRHWKGETSFLKGRSMSSLPLIFEKNRLQGQGVRLKLQHTTRELVSLTSGPAVHRSARRNLCETLQARKNV